MTPPKQPWEVEMYRLYFPFIESDKPIPQYVIDNYKKELKLKQKK